MGLAVTLRIQRKLSVRVVGMKVGFFFFLKLWNCLTTVKAAISAVRFIEEVDGKKITVILIRLTRCI